MQARAGNGHVEVEGLCLLKDEVHLERLDLKGDLAGRWGVGQIESDVAFDGSAWAWIGSDGEEGRSRVWLRLVDLALSARACSVRLNQRPTKAARSRVEDEKAKVTRLKWHRPML